MAYTFLQHNNIQVLEVDNLWNPLDNQAIVRVVEEKIVEGFNDFVIDMGQMEYMNSSGLNFLISILTRARSAGGDVVIINVSEKIQQVLLIARLNSMFAVHNSLEEGLAFFEEIAKQ
ncbi:MAG: STAS domain-containing protein [Aureispira sp.]|nr:STAS domain-containing protein [Aureispira sp.]